MGTGWTWATPFKISLRPTCRLHKMTTPSTCLTLRCDEGGWELLWWCKPCCSVNLVVVKIHTIAVVCWWYGTGICRVFCGVYTSTCSFPCTYPYTYAYPYTPQTTPLSSQFPMYTSQRYLPPAKLINARLTDAMVGNGSILDTCVVDSAVVGHRVRIGKNCVIRDAIVHGCDFYESKVMREEILKTGRCDIIMRGGRRRGRII